MTKLPLLFGRSQNKIYEKRIFYRSGNTLVIDSTTLDLAREKTMPKGLEPTIIQSIRVPYSQLREIELLSFQTGLPRHRIMREALTEFLINRGFPDVKKSS